MEIEMIWVFIAGCVIGGLTGYLAKGLKNRQLKVKCRRFEAKTKEFERDWRLIDAKKVLLLKTIRQQLAEYDTYCEQFLKTVNGTTYIFGSVYALDMAVLNTEGAETFIKVREKTKKACACGSVLDKETLLKQIKEGNRN